MEKNPSIKESTLRNNAVDDQEFMSEPVPMDKRHSTKDQIMVWIGFGYVVTGLVVGGQIGGQGGAGLPPLTAFLSVALGMGFLFFLTSFLGIASQKTGYNLSLLCRFSYGERGSNLPLAMMSLMTLGWFASIAGMIGQIWGAWIGNPSGVVVFDPNAHGFHGVAAITLEEFLSTFVWGLIFTYTAVRGMGAIEKVANIFAPFIMIVAIVMGFAGGRAVSIPQQGRHAQRHEHGYRDYGGRRKLDCGCHHGDRALPLQQKHPRRLVVRSRMLYLYQSDSERGRLYRRCSDGRL